MERYDEILNREVGLILNELYFNPLNMGERNLKRVVFKTEKRYVDYLVEHQLVVRISAGDGNGKWGMQLERKGYEVFEKYNGWIDYKKKVIDKEKKVEKAKSLAQQFWWIPIVISIVSLLFSIITLIIKK
jgi:hypothetical protein